jgi:malate synthase
VIEAQLRTDDLLTREAIEFVTLLQREFGAERERASRGRQSRAARFRAGELTDFLEETRSVREDDWRVPAAPADLQDRRVEITGPTATRW